MRISPLDVRQQTFTTRFRGFDTNEVFAFLEDVAEDYETVIKENALLREQVEALEERGRGVVERERILQETLIATQRLTEEMKDAARREGALHVREAEMRSEKVVEAARGEEARILTEIQNLKRARRQLMEDLRSTLETYQRWVADFSADGEDSPVRT